jgi:hypothetical protein
MYNFLPGFVVSSKKGDSFWVFDFETEEIFKCFNRVIASINEISNEDIAGLFYFST